MSQGPRGDVPWPMLLPGSATSMTNFLPLNGRLVPRSRLSSLNTLRTFANIRGISPRHDTAFGSISDMWISSGTRHGVIQSNGSISVASFTSAFGLGVSGINEGLFLWHHVQIYYPGDADNYVLVAAPGVGSYGTLVMTYFAGSNLRTSYLTSAPKAQCVGAFDNYLVAWNVQEGDVFVNRVKWCQRGSPSNWTGEGAGFEDLLEVRGSGNRVIGTQDNRLILFSTHEIWYGLPATYPAQFQFYPLDRTVGLMGPMTVQETDLGIIFLGSDLHLRLLPRGGGQSQIIAPSLRETLQRCFTVQSGIGLNMSFGVFDPVKRIYYLYLDQSLNSISHAFAVNMDTGEWGRVAHSEYPKIGCAVVAPNDSTMGASTMWFGNSNGTVFSDNSRIGQDSSAAGNLEATWDSPVIAMDLPANWKQIVQVDIDYRSFSTATAVAWVSPDGGVSFPGTGVATLTLPVAPIAGRKTSQLYRGGQFPMVRIQSSSTGVELHRVDITMALGGRGA